MKVIRPSPSGRINVVTHITLGEPPPETKALLEGDVLFLQEEVSIIEPTVLPEPYSIKIVREPEPKKLSKKRRKHNKRIGE